MLPVWRIMVSLPKAGLISCVLKKIDVMIKPDANKSCNCGYIVFEYGYPYDEY